MLGRATVSLLSVLSFTWVLDVAGIFKLVEKPLTTVIAILEPTPSSSNVQVVLIEDEDHEKLFDGQIPIRHPDQLIRIVDDIAMGRPRIIGVDIDTSDSVYESIRCKNFAVPVIWARNVTYSRKRNSYYAADVLGGKYWESSGISVLFEDDDGIIRRYKQAFSTNRGISWLLPMALINYGKSPLQKTDDDERLITYYGDAEGNTRRHRPTLSEIIKVAENDPDRWRSSGLMRDKDVLLGVAYAGEDEHQTPLGPMRGVDILAQIMDTARINAKPANRTVLAAVIAFGVLGLILLFEEADFRLAVAISALAIPSFSVFAAIVLFHSVRQCWYLMIALIIVLLHRLMVRYIEQKKKAMKKEEVSCTKTEKLT